MKHVFIAYKHHEDSVFAELLTHKIRDAGFEVWIDHSQLQAGENWRREIDSAIKNSLALIVIMTPAAKASEHVTYEWTFALGVGVKIIPILHKKTELHSRLKALQFLNFTNSEFFPWPSLINALNNLNKEANASLPSLTPVPQNMTELPSNPPRKISSDYSGEYNTKNDGSVYGQVIGDHSTVHIHFNKES